MIVQLTESAATVAEADDCGRLHVACPLPDAELERALDATGTGRLQEDHVLLDLELLHARARAAAGGPDWEERWQRMLDYAARNGWLTDDGRAVRAHLERTQ